MRSDFETALFRNLGVNLRNCLCGVRTEYASAQFLDFLDLAKNCSFLGRYCTDVFCVKTALFRNLGVGLGDGLCGVQTEYASAPLLARLDLAKNGSFLMRYFTGVVRVRRPLNPWIREASNFGLSRPVLKEKAMRRTLLLVLMSLLFGLSALPAGAGEITADVNADVSILSDYVWRGQNYGEGGIIQPNFSIGFASGLSLGVWANYNIDDNRYASHHQVNEVDYTVDYSRDLGPVGISLGWIFYDFPRTGGLDTQELYVGVSLDVPLSPSITAYRDIHEVDGTYINASIGHDFSLSDLVTLSLGASLAWGSESYHNGYFGVKDDSLSDYNLSAAVAFALSDKITVTPMIAYSGLADDDLEKAAETGFYEDDSNFYGGVNVSYSF